MDQKPQLAAQYARRTLMTWAILLGVLCILAFTLGFVVGNTQPRPPTFSENVYKQNETAVLNHDRRCAIKQVEVPK